MGKQSECMRLSHTEAPCIGSFYCDGLFAQVYVSQEVSQQEEDSRVWEGESFLTGCHPMSVALTYTTPPRETVAGEQWFMWLISSSSLIVGVRGIFSLLAKVSMRLSSITVFMDCTHKWDMLEIASALFYGGMRYEMQAQRVSWREFPTQMF